MPFVEVKANFEIEEAKVLSIKDRLGKLIELLPGKSEKWLMVQVEDNKKIFFDSSADKAILVQVDLYGKSDDKSLNTFTANISEYLESELGVKISVIDPLSLSVACHIGPNALAVAGSIRY